jgi:hypothetical protein
MHRNTYLLITFLAVFAALVVGVNVGKTMHSGASTSTVPTPTATITPTLAPTLTYTNEYCGFSLQHPNTLSALTGATGSAFLINTTTTSDSIAIACQEDIPRPPLSADKIETSILYTEDKTASVTARLYHDASPKDGKPMDELIFTHPTTGLDVFIAGFGETFNTVIASIKLLP